MFANKGNGRYFEIKFFLVLCPSLVHIMVILVPRWFNTFFFFFLFFFFFFLVETRDSKSLTVEKNEKKRKIK